MLTEMSVLLLWCNSLVSFRYCLWKLLLVRLNCMFLSISIRSDSKFANSSIAGGHLLNQKSNVFLSDISSFLRNCDAFHLILFMIFSTSGIKCIVYSFFDETRIFFFNYSMLNLSISLDINDKVFNNNKGAFLYK